MAAFAKATSARAFRLAVQLRPESAARPSAARWRCVAPPSQQWRLPHHHEFGAAYRDAWAAREPVLLEVIVEGSV
jgi:hypothetical protein